MSISYFLHPTSEIKLGEELSRSCDVSYREGCIRYPTPPEEKQSSHGSEILKTTPYNILQTSLSSSNGNNFELLSPSYCKPYLESPWKANFISYQDSSDTLATDQNEPLFECEYEDEKEKKKAREMEIQMEKERKEENEANGKERAVEQTVEGEKRIESKESNEEISLTSNINKGDPPPNGNFSNSAVSNQNWKWILPHSHSSGSNSDDTWHTSSAIRSEDDDDVSSKSDSERSDIVASADSHNDGKPEIKSKPSTSSVSQINSRCSGSSGSGSSASTSSFYSSSSSSSSSSLSCHHSIMGSRGERRHHIFCLGRIRGNDKFKNNKQKLEVSAPTSSIPAIAKCTEKVPRKRDKFKILSVLVWKRYFSFKSRSSSHLP